MAALDLPALLLTHLPDVRYLTGFTGSNAAVAVVRKGARTRVTLFTDGRYTEQARLETKGAAVRIVKGSAGAHAATLLVESGSGKLGFDPGSTSVAMHAELTRTVRKAARAGGHASRLVAVPDLVATLRQVKDTDEQQQLARAAALGCRLYEQMLTVIAPGMREVDVAAELEFRARKAGAEGMSFDTIVAAGVRSSMPHAHATTAVLRAGEMLTLDFGIMLGGYASDMTRTLRLGQAGSKARGARQREVFEAVLAAQENAVARVAAGVPVSEVDGAAREVLQQRGLAKWFTHSTGHGLGLEIHEGPRIGDKGKEVLQAGMVVTVEPGVYLPGEFGVRIEDTVLVTGTGCEILTPAYKGWLEL